MRGYKKGHKKFKEQSACGKIWGKEGAVKIKIPTLIDEFNFYIGSVYLADQRISYYHATNLVCCRNWVPMFTQTPGLIQNNDFLMYFSLFKKDALSHKDFVWVMITWLRDKASAA